MLFIEIVCNFIVMDELIEYGGFVVWWLCVIDRCIVELGKMLILVEFVGEIGFLVC